ncbi:MAG: zinc-binding dehydrogenase, partial [Candidatus Binatia bacterium]
CARLLGAGKIFAIDHHEDRLALAAGIGATPIHFDRENAADVVRAETGGRGADVVAETVGKRGAIDTALPLARPYGTVILLGYIGPGETIDIGEASLKHVLLKPALIPAIRRYQPRVMQLIAEGRLDPTPILSHTLPLEQAPRAYRMMAERQDGAIKVILKP